MTQKAKRKLSEISFDHEGAHLALCSKSQGAANNWNKALIMKGHNFSPEFIQKMQQIQVTYELPDFLRKVMGMYYEDAELLARMMGYVEPEKEEEDYDDWYENYIEEKLQSFTIIKALHEAKNLPDALSKLTEQDYLDVLQDQAMVEKAKFVEIQKQFEDNKVALEKALEQLNKFEQEKKEAIVKSKTDAVKAVVKDEKQAAVVVKAALALEDQADFDALVEVFKSMNDLLEKSGLFQEQGVSAEAAEDNKESKLAQVIKSKYAKQ